MFNKQVFFFSRKIKAKMNSSFMEKNSFTAVSVLSSIKTITFKEKMVYIFTWHSHTEVIAYKHKISKKEIGQNHKYRHLILSNVIYNYMLEVIFLNCVFREKVRNGGQEEFTSCSIATQIFLSFSLRYVVKNSFESM